VASPESRANGVVVLDTTPFYAESGGQVGDEGELVSGSARFEVADTQKIKADVFGHHGTLAEGTLNVGDMWPPGSTPWCAVPPCATTRSRT
jgi:alanyl-tRNA synthetase